MTNLPYEIRHPCNNCKKQWCKCHHIPRYRYPDWVPVGYNPRTKGFKRVKIKVINDEKKCMESDKIKSRL